MWYVVYTRTSAWRLFTTSLDIKHDFVNFYYRAPNKLMLIWDSSISNYYDLQTRLKFLYSYKYSTCWSYITHVMSADSFRSISEPLAVKSWKNIQRSPSMLTQTLKKKKLIPPKFFQSLNPYSIVGMTKNRKNSFNKFLLLLLLFSCHIYF